MKMVKLLTCSAMVVLLQASVVQAQLTWDPDNDQISNGGAGTWDTVTSNWDNDGSAPNTTWVNGSSAVFGDYAANYTVDLDAGVSVGNLTYEGTNTLWLKALVDNTALTLAGNATWNTGGANIRFLNDTLNDTALSMTSGDTLTVVGGGLFDTGEKGNGANWTVAGATLDVADAATVRGAIFSIGQFETVKLAGGSTFIQERNSNQWLANDWVLGGDEVTFDNRFVRGIGLSGTISGTARLVAKNLNGIWIKPSNTNNTFTGGIAVDNGTSGGDTQFVIDNTAVLGPVPATLVADNIILRNGGLLKMDTNVIELEATRGITLSGSGGVINSAKAHTINGPITGEGPFLVGRNDDFANMVTLTSTGNDYTGGTKIRSGSLKLGVDNALPTDGLLTIGAFSGKNGHFRMNGFNQTIGGLTLGGGNTKEVHNNGGSDSTLTIDVANGENYSYNANFNGSNLIHIVKSGLGTQRFEKTGYTTPPASLTVNAGELVWNSDVGPSGLTTVNSGGTLGGIGTLTNDVVVNAGGALSPGNPGGWNSLKIQGGNLDLSGMIDDNVGGLKIGFGAAQDSIVVSTNSSGLGGTIDMDGPSGADLGFSDFTFTDQNGVASGVYPILVAQSIVGTLDAADLGGSVGDLGATGMLSLSNHTVWLTIDGVDTSEYGQWASTFDLPKGSDLVDTDDDGYNNFQEFAFGGDPTNSAITGLVPVAGTYDDGSTNWLTMVYGERTNDNPGVTYDVETINNLVIGTWTNAGITFMGYGVTVDGITPATNAIPIDGTQDFLGVFLEKQE
ncbi:hypothetical protein PDESU_03059 [Pontiella desulfatans]|uniref:Uncharacterized protein n=1 Tax=Pontiella desulfatans TaxID=2750659 RepID=A0A6C2U3T3_PONDE|nr:hypothetical protein [Pontiella desulfatans]VGO14497.1 hypothetical protein PDESU_03059 [Pontiella desulfatans]